MAPAPRALKAEPLPSVLARACLHATRAMPGISSPMGRRFANFALPGAQTSMEMPRPSAPCVRTARTLAAGRRRAIIAQQAKWIAMAMQRPRAPVVTLENIIKTMV
eukprot:COSAG01_NODE_51469_length_354_cov_1.631373_1_plen_105_part_01